jgi:hypothetical protein
LGFSPDQKSAGVILRFFVSELRRFAERPPTSQFRLCSARIDHILFMPGILTRWVLTEVSMKYLSKATLALAAAATVISATPAQAGRFDRNNGDGISTGDVIAGALIIGGIAAVTIGAAIIRAVVMIIQIAALAAVPLLISASAPRSVRQAVLAEPA